MSIIDFFGNVWGKPMSNGKLLQGDEDNDDVLVILLRAQADHKPPKLASSECSY